MTYLTLLIDTFNTILFICIFSGLFIGWTVATIWYELRFRLGIKWQMEHDKEVAKLKRRLWKTKGGKMIY